jgi:hypothetical protein
MRIIIVSDTRRSQSDYSNAVSLDMHCEYQYLIAILTMIDNSDKQGSDFCNYRLLIVI